MYEVKLFQDRRIYIMIIFVIMTNLVGVGFYNHYEGLNYLDALYFSSMTMTTVGYGDIVVKTDIGKIFTIFYSFIGLGLILTMFKIIGDHTKLFIVPRKRNKVKK